MKKTLKNVLTLFLITFIFSLCLMFTASNQEINVYGTDYVLDYTGATSANGSWNNNKLTDTIFMSGDSITFNNSHRKFDVKIYKTENGSSTPLTTVEKESGTYTYNVLNNNVTLTYDGMYDVNVYINIPDSKYTLSYNLNGGSGSAPSDVTDLSSGSQVTLSAGTNVSKAGYTFGGWNENELGTGTNYNVGDTYLMSSKDTMLYAKWELVDYTITYNLDGGTNSSNNPQTYNIETGAISLLNASKTNYAFMGWYSDSNLTNQVTEIAAGSTEDVILYAKWEKIISSEPTVSNSYTIGLCDTYKNDDTVTYKWYEKVGSNKATFINGEETNQLSTSVVMEFNAIYYCEVYAKPALAIESQLIATSISLSPMTVTFNGNGGIGTNPSAIYQLEGRTITLPSNPFTKVGYSFDYWETKYTYGLEGATFTVNTKDNNLVAKWSVIDYTITYENLYDVTNTNPETYNIESETITLKTLFRPGYKHLGWYSDSNFTNKVTKIAKGSTGDVILYAKWEEFSHEHGTSGSDGYINFNIPLTSDFTGGTLSSGNYCLAEDITITSTIVIAENATVNICLNGHVLTSNLPSNLEQKCLFLNYGNLGLYDCGTTTHKFDVNEVTGFATHNENATGDNVLEVTGGCITGFNINDNENNTYTNVLICSNNYDSSNGLAGAYDMSVTIDSVTFVGNSITGYYGTLLMLVRNNDSLNIKNVDVINNKQVNNKNGNTIIEVIDPSFAGDSYKDTSVNIDGLNISNNYFSSKEDNAQNIGLYIFISKGNSNDSAKLNHINISNNYIEIKKAFNGLVAFYNTEFLIEDSTINNNTIIVSSAESSEYTYGIITSNGGTKNALTIKDTTINENTITIYSSNLSGGLIKSAGELTLDGVTISENKINNNSNGNGINGGLICYQGEGELIVKNNTVISSNEIKSKYIDSYITGGLIFGYTSDATFDSTTVINNNTCVIAPGSNGSSTLLYLNNSDVEFNGNMQENIVSDIIFTDNSFKIHYYEFCGGLIYSNKLSMDGAYIYKNTISHLNNVHGGLFNSVDGITMSNATIDSNKVTLYDPDAANFESLGNLIYALNAGITFNNVDITNNTVELSGLIYGGLIYAKGNINATKFNCDSNIITGETYAAGGAYGLIIQGKNITLDKDTTFNSNSITTKQLVFGGILYSTGNLTSSATFNENTLTFTNYAKSSVTGEMIYVANNLTISEGKFNNNTIYNNSGTTGGILLVRDATEAISIQTCEFKNNSHSALYSESSLSTSRIEGFIIYADEDINMNNVTIDNNTLTTGNATADGGLLSSFIYGSFSSVHNYYSDVTISNSSLSNNTYTATKGAIYGGLINAYSVSIDNTTIENNVFTMEEPTGIGVGALIYSETLLTLDSLADIKNNSLTINEVDKDTYPTGKGLFIYVNDLDLKSDIKFDNNTFNINGGVTVHGAFIYINTPTYLTNSHDIDFVNNKIYSTGYLDLDGALIYVNNLSSGEMTYNNVNISNNIIKKLDNDSNVVSRLDGFICINKGHLVLNNCEIKENEIYVSCSEGMFVFTGGYFRINNSSFSNNTINTERYISGLIFSQGTNDSKDTNNSNACKLDNVEIVGNACNFNFNNAAPTSNDTSVLIYIINYYYSSTQFDKAEINSLTITDNTIKANSIYMSIYVREAGADVDNLTFSNNDFAVDSYTGLVVCQSVGYGTINNYQINLTNSNILSNNVVVKTTGLGASYGGFIFVENHLSLDDLKATTVSNTNINNNNIKLGYYKNDELVLVSEFYRGIIIYSYKIELDDVNINDNTFTMKDSQNYGYGLVYIEYTSTLKDTDISNNKIIGGYSRGIVYVLARRNYTYTFDGLNITNNTNITEYSYEQHTAGLYLQEYETYKTSDCSVILKNKIVVKDNKYNETISNCYMECGDSNSRLLLTVDADSPLTSDSYISFVVYPTLSESGQHLLVVNGKDYIDRFESEKNVYYIKSVDNDVYMCGRVISQPTSINKVYSLYLEDFIADGVTASYQWYKYVDGTNDVLITSQNTNTYTYNKYIIAEVYCLCSLSNGFAYKSSTIKIQPSIIDNPSDSNDYLFDVDKTNLEESGSTINYQWFKKTEGEGSAIEPVDNTKAKGIAQGTNIYADGENIGQGSSIYNSELGSWQNGFNEEAEVYEYFLFTIELKKGQILFVSCDQMNAAERIYKGDCSKETGETALYASSGLYYGALSGYYYINEDGIYSIISVSQTWDGSQSPSNYYIYTIDVEFEDLEQSSIVNYSTKTTVDCLDGVEVISIYDSSTSVYYSNSDTQAFCVNVELTKDQMLSILPTTSNTATSLELMVFYKNGDNFEQIDDLAFGEFGIFYVAPNAGSYMFVVAGFNDNDDLVPVYLEIKTLGLENVDPTSISTFNTRTENADLEVYLYSEIDDNGYVTISDEMKEAEGTKVAATVKLEEGDCLFVNLLGYSYMPIVYVFYSNTSDFEYGMGNVFAVLMNGTGSFVAPQEGYYGLVYNTDYNDALTAMRLFKLSSATYEEISYSEAKLENQDSGEYYCQATYTQGNDTYKLKSKTISYVSHTITYSTTDTLTGTLPADTYKYIEGRKATVASTDAYKTNYKIVGWSTVENSTTVEYAFGSKITLSSDIVLYPVYGEKAAISITDSAQSGSYTGSSISFELKGTNKDAGSFTVEYKVGGTWTETAPTNAGSYDVKITRGEDKDYKAYSKEISNGLVINKAKVSEPTISVISFTYDGLEHEVTITGAESFMTKSSDSVTKATSKGVYTVTYTLDSNHEWSDGSDGIVTWSIGVGLTSITLSSESNITKVYGESFTLPTAESNFGEVSCDKSLSDLVNVGTYTVTYSVAGTNDYSSATKSITVTITKKNVNVVWNNLTYIYSGEVQTITASYTNIDGEVVELNVTTNNEFKEVGTYTATAEFKNNETNYCLVSNTKEYTIIESKEIEFKDEVTEENNENKVEIIAGSIDISIKVVIDEDDTEDESILENIKSAVSKASEIIAKFEIHLEDQNGVEVENIDGNTYRVTLTIPEELRGRQGYAIVYINTEDNTVEKYDSESTDSTITFETSHFSTWAIVADVESSIWIIIPIILGSLLIIFIGLFIIWKIEYDKAAKENDLGDRTLSKLDPIYLPINKLLNKIFKKKQTE